MRGSSLSLVLVAAITASASATSYRELSQNTFAADAAPLQTITGRIIGVHPEWNRGRIASRVILELETPANDGSSTVELLVPGGTIEGVAMRVSGAPQFTVGEHTRVTVRATRFGLRLAGLANGKVLLP